MRWLLRIGKTLALGVLLLMVIGLAINSLTYINFDPSYSFLRLKQQAVASGWYLPAYYSHVLVSGLVLVAGFFQLFPASTRRFLRVHRALGYFYVMGILFFCAPGALGMSLFVNRGPWVLVSFLLQSALWFYFTAMAFDRIRKHDIAGHKLWMWRSYGLTFAAVTLRFYIFLTGRGVDLTTPQAYAVLAWLSWIPNLLLVEILFNPVFLRKTKKAGV